MGNYRIKSNKETNRTAAGAEIVIGGLDDLIGIGRIAGTFSFDGTLRVFPTTDFPERFKKMKKVKMERGGVVEHFAVESARPHKGMYLLKLSGIDSMEKAQEYKNAQLVIDQDELMPLPEGEYYHFQLEGLKVIDEERGFLGQVSEVLGTGANDVYVIQSAEFGEVLIPAIKDVVLAVDLAAGEIKVRLLPGLIED